MVLMRGAGPLRLSLRTPSSSPSQPLQPMPPRWARSRTQAHGRGPVTVWGPRGDRGDLGLCTQYPSGVRNGQRNEDSSAYPALPGGAAREGDRGSDEQQSLRPEGPGWEARKG